MSVSPARPNRPRRLWNREWSEDSLSVHAFNLGKIVQFTQQLEPFIQGKIRRKVFAYKENLV